jgi:hypothetical protein
LKIQQESSEPIYSLIERLQKQREQAPDMAIERRKNFQKEQGQEPIKKQTEELKNSSVLIHDVIICQYVADSQEFL